MDRLGCIGLAFADAPVGSLSDLVPQALAFVGNTSPASHLLEHAAGTARLAALAADRMLIVDTCGYIQGGGARRMHQIEFDLLQPAHVIALQRNGELEPILAPLRHRTGCRVHTPPIPAAVTRKSPALRAQRRAMRLASYFETTTLHTFAFDDVALVGTWLGGSDPLPPHLLKFLNQALGFHTRIYHAEMCDRVLGLMVSRPLPTETAGLAMVQEQLKPQSLAVTVAPQPAPSPAGPGERKRANCSVSASWKPSIFAAAPWASERPCAPHKRLTFCVSAPCASPRTGKNWVRSAPATCRYPGKLHVGRVATSRHFGFAEREFRALQRGPLVFLRGSQQIEQFRFQSPFSSFPSLCYAWRRTSFSASAAPVPEASSRPHPDRCRSGDRRNHGLHQGLLLPIHELFDERVDLARSDPAEFQAAATFGSLSASGPRQRRSSSCSRVTCLGRKIASVRLSRSP